MRASKRPAASAADRLASIGVRFLDPDQDISSVALAELIRLGKKATPMLIRALEHENPRTRRLAAEGLGELADRASADALMRATHDSSGEVRARAATALHRLGDPRAWAALVATLDDYPDILHSPYTASMYPLMRAGKDLLPMILPLLRAGDVSTRQRAMLIVKAIVGRDKAPHDWEALWQKLGSYDATAPQTERDQAVQLWLDWLATHA